MNTRTQNSGAIRTRLEADPDAKDAFWRTVMSLDTDSVVVRGNTVAIIATPRGLDPEALAALPGVARVAAET